MNLFLNKLPNEFASALGSIDFAGRSFSKSEVQLALYVVIGLIVLILLLFLIGRIRDRSSIATEVIPQYEEIFEIETEIFETNPYKNDPDTYFEQSVLRTVTLTLIIGLREYLVKMAENASDQHKAMAAIAKHLEANEVLPIAFTQWNQSPIQGIAARIILNGKSRTALFGPSLAMAKASTKFPNEIAEAVERAHAAGQSVFVLAIDGLAYGVFCVSHRLQLIAATS
ncbi:MAG: hypothetical protein ACOYK0_02975 [Candidatus Nanopelagicaceae bacterium]